jgi:hypothetical protein
MKTRIASAVLATLLFSTACDAPMETPTTGNDLLDKYTEFTLTADLSGLSENQRRMIPLLIEASRAMDDMYWMQAYGDREALLESISDPALREFAEINYGPWDRLNGNAPFIEGVGDKPAGATFYPVDMTTEEFDRAAAEDPSLKSLYTVVRRDDAGGLVAIPYSEMYGEQLRFAAGRLRKAAELADDPGFKLYLEQRAEAFETDEYQPSDLAWMDMKDNMIDVVIGPIEVYEDELYNYKAAAESYVLLKDMEWSARLARYADFLPALQEGLPVPPEYKSESPGTDSDLNAYDVLYYAGQCNAGSKTIAINLPNDEEVQRAKGSRRLQLKNAMRAKFDKILLPIAGVLIAEDQRDHVTFDAFFANTMFHEVAHGLGIKQALTGRGTVREALREQYSALEEGKADILGLYMVTSLNEQGELGEADLMDNLVTFMAGIFRSVRFGASSSHGKANMIRFNFFEEMGAFSRDAATGTYRVDPEKLQAATDALTERILTIQGDGDYDAAKAFVEDYGVIGEQLQADLDRLGAAGIPVDIVFSQGEEVLGL